jgi:hypothetical protein
MKMFDFSDLKPKTFQYQERYYRICYDIRGIGWFINRYNSLWDYSRPWGAPEQCLGEYFTNPFDLLRTVKVDGLSIEEIINILPESDPTQWPIYDYNYERFLIDISHKMEFSFSFRKRSFYIDYWETNDKDPNWAPGWIFIADDNSKVLVTTNNFEDFIRYVDHWFLENVGKSLIVMFNDCYKADRTGELLVDSIYL